MGIFSEQDPTAWAICDIEKSSFPTRNSAGRRNECCDGLLFPPEQVR